MVSREMVQTHVNIFHSKNMMPYVSVRKLQKPDLHS